MNKPVINNPIGSVSESVYLKHVPAEDEKLSDERSNKLLKRLRTDHQIFTPNKKLMLNHSLLERKMAISHSETVLNTFSFDTLSIKNTHENQEAPSAHGQIADKYLANPVKSADSNSNQVACISGLNINKENFRLPFKAYEYSNQEESAYPKHVSVEDEKPSDESSNKLLKRLRTDHQIFTPNKKLMLNHSSLERKMEISHSETVLNTFSFDTLSIKDTHGDKEVPSAHGQIADKDLTKSVKSADSNPNKVA
ncbi:MAG: hypothetical protein KAG53_06220 [Endozoicomonadaceae bacterium]|nr:hypothetical protein [Endozoicomonadaceae bacterium]